MIDVAMLKPSEIRQLAGVRLSAAQTGEILSSLAAVLTQATLDGGAINDHIGCIADDLRMARAWEQISASRLASALVEVPLESAWLFISNLPLKYSADVTREWRTELELKSADQNSYGGPLAAG
nr:hypothetical protein [uncultured Gellertiella sp.]